MPATHEPQLKAPASTPPETSSSDSKADSKADSKGWAWGPGSGSGSGSDTGLRVVRTFPVYRSDFDAANSHPAALRCDEPNVEQLTAAPGNTLV